MGGDTRSPPVTSRRVSAGGWLSLDVCVCVCARAQTKCTRAHVRVFTRSGGYLAASFNGRAVSEECKKKNALCPCICRGHTRCI